MSDVFVISRIEKFSGQTSVILITQDRLKAFLLLIEFWTHKCRQHQYYYTLLERPMDRQGLDTGERFTRTFSDQSLDGMIEFQNFSFWLVGHSEQGRCLDAYLKEQRSLQDEVTRLN